VLSHNSSTNKNATTITVFGLDAKSLERRKLNGPVSFLCSQSEAEALPSEEQLLL
jgi:hypothetical protein